MLNTYTINIQNNSGNDKTYALASEIPILKHGKVKGTIWHNVMGLTYAAKNKAANFVISKQFIAVTGAYGSVPGVGVSVGKITSRDVALGQKSGTLIPGTTLNFTTVEGRFPQFKAESTTNAPEGTFEIVTDDSFTYEQAKAKNWYIGLGGTVETAESAAVTWIPEPSTMYQIQPATKYYVNFGKYDAGSIVDMKLFGKALVLDFGTVNNPVNVVQDDKNRFFVQQP